MRKHVVGDGEAAEKAGGCDDEQSDAEEWGRVGEVMCSDVSCMQDEHVVSRDSDAVRNAVSGE